MPILAKHGKIQEAVGKNKKHVNQEYSLSKKGKDIKEGTQKSRILSVVSFSFFAVSLSLSIFLITFTIIYFYSSVEGGSMMLTLNPDFNGTAESETDSVLVNRHKSANRGDIIIVRFYNSNGKMQNSNGERFDFHIKRLIAVGGDTMYVERTQTSPERYTIHLNGLPLVESYIASEFSHNRNLLEIWRALNNNTYIYSWLNLDTNQTNPGFRKWIDDHSRFEIVIPHGFIFYLGDNRAASTDSSSYGPKPVQNIAGVATTIIRDNQSLPQYLWNRFVYYITFRWV